MPSKVHVRRSGRGFTKSLLIKFVERGASNMAKNIKVNEGDWICADKSYVASANSYESESISLLFLFYLKLRVGGS